MLGAVNIYPTPTALISPFEVWPSKLLSGFFAFAVTVYTVPKVNPSTLTDIFFTLLVGVGFIMVVPEFGDILIFQSFVLIVLVTSKVTLLPAIWTFSIFTVGTIVL